MLCSWVDRLANRVACISWTNCRRFQLTIVPSRRSPSRRRNDEEISDTSSSTNSVIFWIAKFLTAGCSDLQCQMSAAPLSMSYCRKSTTYLEYSKSCVKSLAIAKRTAGGKMWVWLELRHEVLLTCSILRRFVPHDHHLLEFSKWAVSSFIRTIALHILPDGCKPARIKFLTYIN